MNRLNLLAATAIFFLVPVGTWAQQTAYPDLPSMTVVTEKATNKLSWNCQYDGVKSIAIQRSNDSVKNFITIGVINNPRKGQQSFIDERPMVGRNNYRLFILFSGDVEWYSNLYKVNLDSATLAKSVNATLSTGTTTANTNYQQNGTASTPVPTDFYFTPSTQVYSNPYTGHININLKDALSRKYSIRFYDPKKNEVLRVSRVSKPVLILDRNNFQSPGTYAFQLFDGTTVVETGYITIY